MKMKKAANNRFFRNLPRYFLLIATILLMLLFYALTPSFLQVLNLMNILRTASIYGILAIGYATVIMTGDMNFSFSSQAALAAVVTGLLLKGWPDAYLTCALIAVLCSVVIGFLPAFFVIHLKVPSFIATMGFMTVFTGLLKVLTNNTILFSNAWGNRYALPANMTIFGMIPLPVVVFIVIAIIAHLFFEKSRTGRYLFAIGASKTTCQQVGINEKRIRYIGFSICSACSGIGGVLYGAMLGQATPLMGSDLILPIIAITMVSATFYSIGKYNVPGIVMSSIIMIVVQNGVIGLGLEAWAKDVSQGLMLVIAVGIIARVRKDGLPKVTFGN